ncbi:hypothetical protein NIES22_73340 (plasmid) [Calothrix brevissima NIES-22]|nr:hypothetical protein NIES22_73340 [Calothrix brevissima NIES-22]
MTTTLLQRTSPARTKSFLIGVELLKQHYEDVTCIPSVAIKSAIEDALNTENVIFSSYPQCGWTLFSRCP